MTPPVQSLQKKSAKNNAVQNHDFMPNNELTLTGQQKGNKLAPGENVGTGQTV